MAKRKVQKKDSLKEIKIVKSVASVYGLSASPGDIIKIDERQASEMIESGHAKELK